jgi:hypothetical protein
MVRVRIGSLVLFLHDIADVLAYSVKAVVDTKYTWLTLSAYAGLLLTWGYTRLYVFPFYVISASTIPGMEQSFAWYTSYAMIWTLQLLHVYWYILFLIMGYRFAISGKTVDIQQKAGESDGSYVDYHKRKDSGARPGAAAAAAASGPSDDADLFSGNGHLDASEALLSSELTAVVPPAAVLRTRSQKKSKRAE